MKLQDARRLAVQRKAQIEFRAAGGTVCQIDQSGVARIPGLAAAAPFRLSEEFEKATEFVLIQGGVRKTLTPAQLLEQAGSGSALAAHSEADE
jgi:hypothetical protein